LRLAKGPKPSENNAQPESIFLAWIVHRHSQRSNTMKRHCLALACTFVALAGWSSRADAADTRPNIVVIMADDFGYECLGVNGGTSYKTPAIDRMAAGGMRFTHCNAQPLCTPTRVQLMTGIYNIRNYRTFGEMDPDSVTFATLLKSAGYATCMAGKWQLGRQVELPKKFGFDEYCLWQHTRRPERYKNPGLEINGVERDWTGGEYGPDLVSDFALDFIRRKKDGPFFLYYPMMLTHDPFTATPDSDDYQQSGAKKKGKADGDARHTHFADMVAYADKLVGKLLAELDALKIRDNTLVVFLGDNGTGKGVRSRMGDREIVGGKGTMTHTGMHVPLVVSWPGGMKGAAGRVSQDMVDSTDILPTICEAAGVKLPLKLDGRSFCPQLRGEKGQPRDWQYSWYAPHNEVVGEFAATRDFKLYRTGEFFDLRKDLDEKTPLAVASQTGDAAAAAKLLQGVLDQFQNARPASLAKPNKKKAA
jgi:arylsulfatase A